MSYFKADAADGKPFFAFATYTTPHWPLQAPAEYLARYRGCRDVGYQALTYARIARQREPGLTPAGQLEAGLGRIALG
ncbi:MAG TPA: hypothetical protein VLC08_12475 [Chitinolyticbacter sp.]|nr:hypothetical protein [Chitinolyticbacter sp.]